MKFISLLKKRRLLIQELNLYALPDQINVLIFFKIMEMGIYPDLNLLKRKQSIKADKALLSRTWNNLREYYFSSINQSSFDKFKREYKETITLQNAIVSIQAAAIMFTYGDKSACDTLEHFGVKGKTLESIKSGLYRKQTALKLLLSKNDSNSKREAESFYAILARVESDLPHQIDIEKTSLKRWVEIVNDIKNKNIAKKASLPQRKKTNTR